MRRLLRRGGAALGALLGLGLVAGALSTSGFASLGGALSGPRLARVLASPRYMGGRFTNERAVPVMRDAGAMWSVAREWVRPGVQRAPRCPLPLFEGAAATLKKPAESGLRLTWLGHSSVLVELDGHRVLTDPHWSARASPSTWVGPRRFHPPPLALGDVPPLDAVVISHDHYDHLDMETVQALAGRTQRFVVPLGVGAHLERWGIPAAQVVELEWWQAEVLPSGLQLVATPAQHFSGRVSQNNPTLWASWALVGEHHRVFFSGDTGLTPAFEEVARRYGPFDVSMLEVGQYDERWGAIHLGPRGALEAHRMLAARWLLPIHWGTFELGLHAWSGPAEDTVTLAPGAGALVLTPRLGQPVEPEAAPTLEPWWRALPPTAAACP